MRSLTCELDLNGKMTASEDSVECNNTDNIDTLSNYFCKITSQIREIAVIV